MLVIVITYPDAFRFENRWSSGVKSTPALDSNFRQKIEYSSSNTGFLRIYIENGRESDI